MRLPIGKIVQGDCLKILPKLVGQVQLILTDPPYEFSKNLKKGLNKKLRKTKVIGEGDFFAQGENRRSLEKIESTFKFSFEPNRFLKLAFEVCRPFNAYIFTSKHLLEIYLRFAREKSLFYDVLIWNVTNAIPINKGHYLSDKHYCVYLREKGAFFNSNLGYRNYFTVFSSTYFNKSTQHPTEKPIVFVRKMVQVSSKSEDVVLDPFSGSGTTCVAAEQLGRKWVGIEVEKEYCEMARRRIAYEKRNPGLRILK